MVPSGRPSPLVALVTSWPRIVPTVRLTFRILSDARTASPLSSAGRHSLINIWSRAISRA